MLEKKSNTSGLSKPGMTNNPGGRPKIDPRLKDKLKGVTEEVIDFWIATMRDVKKDIKARLQASENIVDRAWGKATQAMTFEDENGQTVMPEITVKFVKPKPDADRTT